MGIEVLQSPFAGIHDLLASFEIAPVWVEGQMPLGNPIAQGGLSQVYSLPHQQGQVIKLLNINPAHTMFEKKLLLLIVEFLLTRHLNTILPAHTIRVDNMCFFENGNVGIVMQQAMEDLEKARENLNLTTDRWLNYALQVAQKIDSLHEHGVYPLDVKPSNFLLLDKSTVVATDLGLSILSPQIQATIGITQDNAAYWYEVMQNGAGTLLYTAPEQPHPSIDSVNEKQTKNAYEVYRKMAIYSFSLTFLQLLTGSKDFFSVPSHSVPHITLHKIGSLEAYLKEDSFQNLGDGMRDKLSKKFGQEIGKELFEYFDTTACSISPQQRPESCGEVFNKVIRILHREA